MFKRFIFLFAFIFFLTFVMSAPPTTTITDYQRGVDIIHPETLNVKTNQDLEFNFWTYNTTNGATLTNTSLNCTLYLINSSGVNFFRFSNQAGASGLITYGKGYPLCTNCWTMVLPKENISEGSYSYQIKCQGLNIGGYVTGFFDATEGGVDFTEARALLTNGLLLLLFSFLFLSLYSLFNVENYIGKFALYWVSHILLVVINFVAWQVGVEGMLSSTALTGIFQVMFWIFTISIFPMLILSLAWVFYIHTFNENFEKLLNKGMSPEEAFKMSSKKKKGWFYGN